MSYNPFSKAKPENKINHFNQIINIHNSSIKNSSITESKVIKNEKLKELKQIYNYSNNLGNSLNLKNKSTLGNIFNYELSINDSHVIKNNGNRGASVASANLKNTIKNNPFNSPNNMNRSYNQKINNQNIIQNKYNLQNNIQNKNNLQIIIKNKNFNRLSNTPEIRKNILLNNSPTFAKPTTGIKLVKNNTFKSFQNTLMNSPLNLNRNDQKINQKNLNNNIYNPSARSVKEYAYKEEKNEECRKSMEDFSKIIDKFMNDQNKGLFSLYDGHGGSELVKYVKDRMPEIISKFLIETNYNAEKSLINSFQKIDNEVKLMSESENVGTTACVVYINVENDIIKGMKKVLYCANVGDTRAILITSNEVKRISYDHKCIDEEEVKRIRKVGGIVFNGRVFGQLALSRAIGDHAMKKYGVIPTPYVSKHIITEKDKFIVICSDGVWDVLTDEKIYEISLDCKNADVLSDEIVKKAVQLGSRDNISCLVVKIN